MKLDDYLKANDISRSEIARRLGVSAVSVTRWINGSRRPRGAVLARIMVVTGGAVTANDFVEMPPDLQIAS